ncbi:MAG TPA: SPOR domain-containing protein [Bryobacteraceae bacterium]|jgi:cell division septation protein DedD|nr:SPOR domain-containing protein [Bryobacteraceae bacterium]
MSQTDGERELVLGNKQLISLFFVVVALCGVFFAIGYMIGHNTSKSTLASAEGNNAASASPATESPVPQSGDSEPPRETAASDTQPLNTTPADSQPAPPESASAPGTVAQAPSTPTPTTPVPSTQTQAAHDTPFVPETGATYLQVTALHRADADNLVKTLREQKLPAMVADSSKPDLFRVLVGPYRQTADVADAKARLKALGFANAFVQK